MNIDLFIKVMKKVPDDKFNETISKGALKLSDEQIDTASFVFWICYMAEVDLEEALGEAWILSSTGLSNEMRELVKDSLKEMVFGKRDLNLEDALLGLPADTIIKIRKAIDQGYIPKRDFDIENLDYFSDKVKIYEAMFGKNDRTKLLWKINGIRNDISHNRINGLKYNGEDLSLRKTKEKLLSDYMSTAFIQDFSHSEFLKGLSHTEKKEIEKEYKKIKEEKINKRT